MRYMNWETDLQRHHSCKASAQHINASPKDPVWLQDIPQMEDSATFDVVLGSDVLYEVRFAAKGLHVSNCVCLIIKPNLQHASDLSANLVIVDRHQSLRLLCLRVQ